MRDLDVVVAGGGASGTLLALQLLRQAPGRRVTVVDRSGAFARGVAYGTRDPAHLLNVRARAMSADPRQPSDFSDWLRAKGQPYGPSDFAPRALYGDYLAELLAAAHHENSSRLHLWRDEVVQVERGRGLHLWLAGAGKVRARALVLATGNGLPAPLRVPDCGLTKSRAWHPSPWEWGRLERLPPSAEVLLVGTGLTAVDAVLTLRRVGHRGRILALSRHGRLPAAHGDEVTPVVVPVRPGMGPREVLRLLRRGAGDAEDWRAAVDGLRSHTVPLWRGFSPSDRARFLRHARGVWDVVRHRMAPEVAAQIEAARADGGLRVERGRLLAFEPAPAPGRWQVRWRHGAEEHTATVDVVVNCTGPSAPGSEGDPLGRELMGRGLARRDSFRLGLQTQDGALVDAQGRASQCLYGMGAVTRPEDWESTAIPELRAQAASLAKRLAGLGEAAAVDTEADQRNSAT